MPLASLIYSMDWTRGLGLKQLYVEGLQCIFTNKLILLCNGKWYMKSLTLSVCISVMYFLISNITVSFSVPILHFTVHKFGSLYTVNNNSSTHTAANLIQDSLTLLQEGTFAGQWHLTAGHHFHHN